MNILCGHKKFKHMKKFVIVFALAGLPLLSFSQVFNTASLLKPGDFSLGAEPVIIQDRLGFFGHLGVGLVPGIDLALKAGALEGTHTAYLGADLEWRLKSSRPSISLTTGAHRNQFGHFGLDGSINFSFSIRKVAYPYFGFDTDVNFHSGHYDYYGHYYDDTNVLMWVPVGVEIYLKSYVSLILEAEIPVEAYNYYVIGGGFTFYIK
jgi:hypothetical protein